ncbi:MAG TPA: histidine--tRNA ligase [Geminicoccus sp.]|jgi:histidyl-tRNA synthetase|uniref:histidine--tRNA ligase n=1 Tax=Geminicoccus sp. TaxID=2024832 RepID=UPI002E3547AE|nr:histidine--tRNA ligase [Geminicoccus sp.]HEX2529338.1 histidine--tRNA ligase [Geminicoccus sp.]
MSDLRPVRGTHDLLGEDMRRHRHVHETARAIAGRYGFAEIETPIFEFTEVFARTLGDTSDVVTKEMYTFTDRGGERLTLRPENTAGVARAFITNGLQQSLPVKLFYHGPMFRYERPQKGRMRQFHQIGIEVLGAGEALADVEVIALGAHILDELGVLSKTVLHLNSLGDPESRAAYRDRLVAYFSGHEAKLSEDSRNRLHKNPLRILDSKDEGDRALVAEAPLMADILNQASQDFWKAVTEGLDTLGIAYKLDPRLVRGLDYYTHTAFEFVTTQLGAQGTVLGGGRYDGLIRSMGGPEMPGVGWAAGVERLAALIEAAPDEPRPLAIVPIGPMAERAAWELAGELRRAGHVVELGYKGKPGQRMKRADRLGAKAALFLGDDELAAGVVKLRDLGTGAERSVPRGELLSELSKSS